jgi:hypothetical protein
VPARIELFDFIVNRDYHFAADLRVVARRRTLHIMADVTEKTETTVPETVGQDVAAADVKPSSAELAGKEEESKTTESE